MTRITALNMFKSTKILRDAKVLLLFGLRKI